MTNEPRYPHNQQETFMVLLMADVLTAAFWTLAGVSLLRWALSHEPDSSPHRD
jgi:hypothetical protein